MTADAQQRPRGRPAHSGQRVEAIKAAITAQALRLFQQEGYHAVSMRRLAQESGCTVMTIYRYYERKIDILRAIWSRIFEDLFDAIDAIALRYRDPADRLEAMALAYVTFWLEHREHYFLVFMSSGVEQADVSIFVQDDAVPARFRIFQQAIGELSAPEADPADLKLRSELLLCTLNGIAHNLITISAYPWAEPGALVAAAVRNACCYAAPT